MEKRKTKKKNMAEKKSVKNHNLFLLIGGIVIFIIILLLTIFLSRTEDQKQMEQRDNLENEIIAFAKDFYETKYYVGLSEESVLQLANFQDIGITFSISDLITVLPMSEEGKKIFDDHQCNSDNSKVIFYPKESYQVADFDVKVELSCRD